jgi:ribitol-5-phosphate 2-dehydrogenase (NADP+) / D-ribitol-5-phosphate cytidylyltransferase
MRKPIALVFGSDGGIGAAVRTAFLDAGYRVIPINRVQLDFNLPTAEAKLIELLNAAEADVIVNSTGVFANGSIKSHQETFNVNFGSNWDIIRYYHALKDVSKPVKIIMVGSSSYSGGKAKYPLYSASKAALYNLWESAQDMFADTDIGVSLINPMRTRTRMNADHYNPELPYHDPRDVAEQILRLAGQEGHHCVNMTLEESK